MSITDRQNPVRTPPACSLSMDDSAGGVPAEQRKQGPQRQRDGNVTAGKLNLSRVANACDNGDEPHCGPKDPPKLL